MFQAATAIERAGSSNPFDSANDPLNFGERRSSTSRPLARINGEWRQF
jgi:hypothetical protein